MSAPAPANTPVASSEPQPLVDCRTAPEHYRHWRLSVHGPVARLVMDVDPDGGLMPGYQLKLNSYDLAVDIELNDAVQRLRFEHPEVGAVVIESGKERVFCAGANIRMLGKATHAHKINFCKFTNETRLAIEDASDCSGQRYVSAIRGSAAGGGYELALATDHIMLADDGNSAVSLPELPLLAVLPGTGGLTRLTDKRKVRRDIADYFCTIEEGARGARAVEWRLVDETVPTSGFDSAVEQRAARVAARSDRPAASSGIELSPIERHVTPDRIEYARVTAELDRATRTVHVTLLGPGEAPPADAAGVHRQGARFWPLALARELDDLMLHLRFNEPALGTWVLHSRGECERVCAYDELLARHEDDWLVREIVLAWKRTLKRLDMSARTLIALVEPGSCFAGTLLEIVMAADRSYMLDGVFEQDNREEEAGAAEDAPEPARLRLTHMNFGPLTTINGLTRLASRYLDDEAGASRARQHCGRDLDAVAANELRLVTFIPDDIDWEDEVRFALEERASFSPDALTGLEANLRLPGPETMESKIFGRLSAWQNWIFLRGNAAGETGALSVFGTGRPPNFDRNRT
ncbi:MAG: 2,3-epoxybenzoyl-CoA dihydrolase [Gammaproteobacteria bacterium]